MANVLSTDESGLPTAARLRIAGLRLFARNGYAATTVGAIEAAAGLAPRRGALYKHYASKEALLHAAIEHHISGVTAAAETLQTLATQRLEDWTEAQLGDLATDLARWLLRELDAQEDMTRLLEHDGARFPEVVAAVRTDIAETGYRTVAALLAAAAPEGTDVEAAAVVLLGGLVALRRTTWTFGQPPLGVDDERAIAACVHQAMAILRP